MKPAIPMSLIAVAAMLAAGSVSAAPVFHPAVTPGEQALGRILKLDGAKPTQVDPTVAATGRRPRTTPPAGAGYLKYLTTPLATAILVAEAKQVKANCGGVYKRGEECGMGADPIICAQDTPDSYLFITQQSGADTVVIQSAWPPDPGGQPSPNGTYRLKLAGGVWKIDGISCAEGGGDFNWEAP